MTIPQKEESLQDYRHQQTETESCLFLEMKEFPAQHQTLLDDWDCQLQCCTS